MKKIFICSVMCALLLTACGGSKKTTYDFTGKMIAPVQINNVDYTEESSEKPVALLFGENNTISGCLGCNFIAAGSYYVNEDTLTFSPLGITRALCDENSNMIEQQMLDILTRTNHYVVENDVINFYQDQELLAKFKFVEKPEGCCSNGEHQCQHGEGEHQCQHSEGEGHQCQKAEGEHQCQKAEGEQTCAQKREEAVAANIEEVKEEVKETVKPIAGGVSAKAASTSTSAKVQGPTTLKPSAESTQTTQKSISVKNTKVNATKTVESEK